MNTTTFFRFEDKRGDGPYRSFGPNLESDCPFWEASSKHPIPEADSLFQSNFSQDGDFDDTIENFLFGFSSMAQLRSWFYDDRVLKWMAQNGFRLWSAEVPVINGNAQAATHREEWQIAEKVEIDIFSLCEK